MVKSGTQDRSKGKGTGKPHKEFLAEKDVLALAVSIAKAQEDKASSRVEKNRGHQVRQSEQGKPRLSASKAKQNETKAMLAAQRARKKREKAKFRKERSRQPGGSTDGDAGTGTHRKKVSFV